MFLAQLAKITGGFFKETPVVHAGLRTHYVNDVHVATAVATRGVEAVPGDYMERQPAAAWAQVKAPSGMRLEVGCAGVCPVRYAASAPFPSRYCRSVGTCLFAQVQRFLEKPFSRTGSPLTF